jgi:Tfp pilus assembly protein PilO
MLKSDFVQALRNKNVRDYTYAIMFFAVSTFFAIAVIRPVLGIAISIQRQAKDLENINQLYEKNITKVLELQAQIEDLRPRKFVLDEALPTQPRVDAVIAEIRSAAAQSNVRILSLAIDPIDLKTLEPPPEERETEMVKATIDAEATFPEIEAFIRAVAGQRRVKGIHNLIMTVNRGSESTVTLTLEIELESYYISQRQFIEQ